MGRGSALQRQDTPNLSGLALKLCLDHSHYIEVYNMKWTPYQRIGFEGVSDLHVCWVLGSWDGTAKNKTINKKSVAFSVLPHYAGLMYVSAELLLTLLKINAPSFPPCDWFLQVSILHTWFNKHYNYPINTHIKCLRRTVKKDTMRFVNGFTVVRFFPFLYCFFI